MPEDRQQRIANSMVQEKPTVSASSAPLVPTHRITGVLLSVNEDSGTMTWQRVRYKTHPPVAEDYELVGKVDTGYPIETTTILDYKNMVGELIYAQYRRGVYLIETSKIKAGGLYVCLQEGRELGPIPTRTGYIAELDPDTLAIKTDRLIPTPGWLPVGIAAGRNYFYHTDGIKSEMYEYRTEDMNLSRIFALGLIGKLTTHILGINAVPLAVGGGDDLVYLFGHSNNGYVVYIIDIVGSDRILTMREEIVLRNIDGFSVNIQNPISGGGGDQNFIYVSTLDGTYYKIDANTRKIVVKIKTQARIPTGFGVHSEGCFSTEYDPDAKISYFQERSVVDLTVINERLAPFFIPTGIG